MNNLPKLSLLTLAILSNAAFAQEAEEQDKKDDAYVERMQIIGHKDKLRTEAGSATLIGEVELEKFEYDDISRVLAKVPGVNIREEDGYGLRPNIGFRGVTPERSKKIVIMEDGVLIGPAPYSAPAAYYFPMVSKMTAVEVFKGPAAIKYGPNTVAGALNLTTRAVPDDAEGMIDLSLGTDGYTKAHGFYGDSVDNLGYLVEVANLSADGFKDLDGGGDTGFDKNDILTKFRYDITSDNYEQVVELKLSYADEVSNETYLGLTDEDFAKTPHRRYAATQAAKMEWEHSQIQLTHFLAGRDFDVTTRVYRNDFERAWKKLNNFAYETSSTNRELSAILANPEDGINQEYYQVLTGQKDSVQTFENLIVGTNDREYYSQGIQSELRAQVEFAGLEHNIHAGVRFHQDQIKRDHFEETYAMRSGRMTDLGLGKVFTSVNLEETDALSVHIQDTIQWNALQATFGVRGEFIDSYYQNRAEGKSGEWLEKESRIWLPSASFFYQASDNLGFLFGVHEGFVPTSPKEDVSVRIENSVNFELGARYKNNGTNFEAVAFFNDFKNLKESCTFSASSNCASAVNTDAEYNGGEVDVYGLEVTAGHTVSLNDAIDMPISVVYTHTQSEFKTSFNSDFIMWGNITAGDELPYLPDNQLTISIGLDADEWQVALMAKYTGEMKEVSGQAQAGEYLPLVGDVVDAYTVVDLTANYDLGDYGLFYLKIDNLLNDDNIVSRRPYGARPSKPQQAFVGYKYSF